MARRARPSEELLAGIWAEVLRLERVGRDGRLLRAGRALAAGDAGGRPGCARSFGVELPLRALFEAPTVAALARARRGERRAGPAGRCRRSCRVARDGRAAALLRPAAALVPRPARAGQRRLQHPARPCGWRARWTSRRWSARWARSCAATRRCAPPSREVDGEPVQVIAPSRRFALPLVDLVGAAGRERGGRGSAALAGEEAARPFDLARGPLLRARRCCGWRRSEHVLLLTMHHIVSDGWSHGRAAARAGGALRGVRRGRGRRRCPSCRSSTPTTPSGSASGCAGEVLERAARLLARAARRARRRCWSCRPTGRARRCRRPAARPRRVRARRGADRGRCRRWAGGEGATLFMVLLAAFQALLSPLHRAGRRGGRHARSPAATRAEIEGLIGFFVNTLVLRGRTSAGDPTFRELLRAGARRRRWAPTRTRTCPSSSWWRSCSRSAA